MHFEPHDDDKIPDDTAPRNQYESGLVHLSTCSPSQQNPRSDDCERMGLETRRCDLVRIETIFRGDFGSLPCLRACITPAFRLSNYVFSWRKLSHLEHDDASFLNSIWEPDSCESGPLYQTRATDLGFYIGCQAVTKTQDFEDSQLQSVVVVGPVLPSEEMIVAVDSMVCRASESFASVRCRAELPSATTRPIVYQMLLCISRSSIHISSCGDELSNDLADCSLELSSSYPVMSQTGPQTMKLEGNGTPNASFVFESPDSLTHFVLTVMSIRYERFGRVLHQGSSDRLVRASLHQSLSVANNERRLLRKQLERARNDNMMLADQLSVSVDSMIQLVKHQDRVRAMTQATHMITKSVVCDMPTYDDLVDSVSKLKVQLAYMERALADTHGARILSMKPSRTIVSLGCENDSHALVNQLTDQSTSIKSELS